MNVQELVEEVAELGDKGVLCEFWTLPIYHVSVSYLAELELVKPITTRIPGCDDHFCRFSEECRDRELFDKKGNGRGGLKAKLTSTGENAFTSPALLAQALLAHRIAGEVRTALADGSKNVLEIHTRLMQRCYVELEQTGDAETTAFRRTDLLGCLELLESTGELEWNRATGRVSLH